MGALNLAEALLVWAFPYLLLPSPPSRGRSAHNPPLYTLPHLPPRPQFVSLTVLSSLAWHFCRLYFTISHTRKLSWETEVLSRSLPSPMSQSRVPMVL